MARKTRPVKDRLLAKIVVDSNGCWIWQGTKNNSGYGTIGIGPKASGKGFAHRISYEVHIGPIPPGFFVCHKCDVKTCVNPDHLFVGTQKDNLDDARSKGRMANGEKWFNAHGTSICNGSKHGMAKLMESQVLEIMKLYDSGENTNKAHLAKQFGVSPAMIRNIVFRKNWTHLMKTNNWPDVSNNKAMSDHQRTNCAKAMQSRIGVLCGAPGVGKTFCLAQIVKAIIEQHGEDAVCIACPTGKAAVRITESMHQSGIEMRARTIHSLLKIGHGESTEFNKRNPLPFRFLLLDECSMIDTTLAAMLMQACNSSCNVLWTGDTNQLSPVGHGAPLRDMIAAGVCYGELTEIIRNSGGIVEACAAMRDQRKWDVGDNLHLVADRPDMMIERINQICHQAKNVGLDPVWDVQIVTAVNEKSPLSRVELNRELHSLLNKQPGEEGVAFRVGDKLVNTKNARFKLAQNKHTDDTLADVNDRDEVWVANGELAKVISVDRKSMVLSLDAPARQIEIYFGQEGGCTFELGYALSVHKSQGSDWPWVVVMLDDYPGARMVCDRSWLYTAISRAKTKCWMLGNRATADRMCRTSKIWHRKTFLRELILMGKALEGLANV